MSSYLPVNVLIVHEDFDAAIRARMTLVPFLDALKPDFAVRLDLWGLDELQTFPLLREDAAAEALAADIVVVTLQEGAELPPAIREWFAIWAPKKKGRPSAFVALSGNGSRNGGGVLPLRAYFREVAQNGGMDFFCPTTAPLELDLSRFMPVLKARTARVERSFRGTPS
jgi:hypothetical protein